MTEWTDGQLIAVAIVIAGLLIARAIRWLPVGITKLSRLIYDELKKDLNQ